MYFLIKIILFSLKIYLFAPKIAFKTIFYNEICKEFRKNQFFSNIFTFLSMIRQKFRGQPKNFSQFLGNFHVKTQKSTDFAHTVSKNYIFFVFFTKDYTFYTINLFIRPKNCVQSNFYNERCKEFHKNHFLVTFLHF